MDFSAGPARSKALKRLRQPGLGIDKIHLCVLQQRCNCRPRPAATVTASDKTIFSCNRLRSDRSLDYVGVDLDTVVRQESGSS